MSGTGRLLELADVSSQELASAPAERSFPGADRAEAAVRNEVSALQQSMRQLEELTAASTGGIRAEAAAAASAVHNQLVAAGERARRMATAPPPPPEPPQAKPPVRVPRMIGDAAGYSLCPDPLAARTPADLMAALRRYRICAGEPSYRTMSRLGRGNLAPSTLCTALGSDELPTLAVVLAVVTACGGNGEDLKKYATAWRRLRLAQEDTRPQARPAKPRAVRRLSAAG
ncbi:MAG: hypothetical protein ACRDPY_12000 [Streptosporangiaceae bacterium]